PPIMTRYLPRASELASAFALGAFATSAACAMSGIALITAMASRCASKSSLMHSSGICLTMAILIRCGRCVRAAARALYTSQMPRLRPGKRLDAVGGQSKTDAGMAHARPGQPRAHAVATVPVRRSRVHLSEDAPRSLNIGRVDASGEPVLGVVYARHRLGFVLQLPDADDRAEALICHQGHAMIDVDEDGGLEPVPFAS